MTEFLLWNDENIIQASRFLRAGEVVAFPTETVYGLGADATSDRAVAKIFQAKGRPSDNPLIVHLSDVSQVSDYVQDIPPVAKILMDAFMPGPLTLILKSNGKIARNVTAGLGTVGVRIPDHQAARALIRQAGIPIAAPSANLSGKPSPTSAVHVYQDLKDNIAAILDGGPTEVGVESTVVDCTEDKAVILRPGGITKQQLENVLKGPVIDATYTKEKNTPRATVMKYQHYEPEVPLVLVTKHDQMLGDYIKKYQQLGKKVGVLATEEVCQSIQANEVVSMGSSEDLNTVANQLYQGLRTFKKQDVDVILAMTVSEEGVGQAIMNRLRKAATGVDVILE